MKKIVLFTFLSAFTSLSFAQIADRTETNCEGESRSIYEVGESGKPLIVASKGFDCGICQSQANSVKVWADNNSDIVEVWGAMTFTYSSGTATCANVNNWNSTYGWNENIFSFVDQDDFWFDAGTPRYYVIHPITHEIEYNGFSFATATEIAIGLITSSTIDNSLNAQFKAWQSSEGVVVEFVEAQEGELRIFNLLGQQVYSERIRNTENRTVIPFEGTQGIYIVSVEMDNGNVMARRIAIGAI